MVLIKLNDLLSHIVDKLFAMLVILVCVQTNIGENESNLLHIFCFLDSFHLFNYKKYEK